MIIFPWIKMLCIKLCLVAYVCDPRTWEPEAIGSLFPYQPGIHSSRISLGNNVSICLKKKRSFFFFCLLSALIILYIVFCHSICFWFLLVGLLFGFGEVVCLFFVCLLVCLFVAVMTQLCLFRECKADLIVKTHTCHLTTPTDSG